MNLAQDLNPAELAALLHFYADAGVDWLVEDEPVDQMAAFAEQKQARQLSSGTGQGAAPAQGDGERRTLSARSVRDAAPAKAPAALTMPDEHAVTEARFVAESARSLEELKTAIEGFTGCNLKTSARSTIFCTGEGASGVMVIGGAPGGDDDRDGQPFAGRAGLLLDRMLASIGLSRDTVMLSTVLPWRPPGDRPPSVQEAAICRPFIDRQIELAEPKTILLLGNVAARLFFGGTDTIHALRGQWRDIACGNHTVSALACLHPTDLIAAPAGKALAWQDLMVFRQRINASQ